MEASMKSVGRSNGCCTPESGSFSRRDEAPRRVRPPRSSGASYTASFSIGRPSLAASSARAASRYASATPEAITPVLTDFFSA